MGVPSALVPVPRNRPSAYSASAAFVASVVAAAAAIVVWQVKKAKKEEDRKWNQRKVKK
jgi:hypothetical protein